MERRHGLGGVKVGVLLSFLLMIAVNGLAERMHLFGVTTADIAGRYPNLLTPPNITFAIWGVIYVLLGLSTLYQVGVIRKGTTRISAAHMSQIGVYFILSSLLNIAWLVAWHADRIGLSFLILLGLLWCLIPILELLRGEELSRQETWFLQVPFAIYAAWVLVAVIANATVLLVKLGWNGFGLSESTWTIMMLALLTLLALAMLIRFRLPLMGVVFLWALGGILGKHLSSQGFDGAYPNLIATLIVAMALVLIFTLYVLFSNRSRKRIR